MVDSAVQSADLLTRGQAALQRGAWMEARDLFAQALTLEETAEALEGYGLSCWWLEEVASMFDYRERAFRLYRARGDSRSAARVATALGVDYADFRGELAVGNGWLERAESLLESVDECAEHGWLALNRGIVRIIFEGDIIGAREQQQKALEIGRRLDIFDLRMLALTLDGLIMVREGNVAEGMRRMDEATAAAVSGEMTDLSAISNACCALIYACEAVADYDRAVQWCNRAKEFSQRWGPASLFAICRSYYATVLVWQGAWTEAEAELTAAAQELEASRPSNALEALAKLGDLRRRQGRHAEAEDLLRRAETHPMALLGKAALALEKSDPDSALDLVRRFLRRITDEDQAERVFALEVAVRARLAGGDIDGAQSDLAEAVSITTLVGTQSLRASSSMSAGLVALAYGDLDRAKDSFEDAIDLFESTGNSFDGGRARLELATTLSRVGSWSRARPTRR